MRVLLWLAQSGRWFCGTSSPRSVRDCSFSLLNVRYNPLKVVTKITSLIISVASQCLFSESLLYVSTVRFFVTHLSNLNPSLTDNVLFQIVENPPPFGLQAIVEPRRGALCRALPLWPLRLPEMARVVNLSAVLRGDDLERRPYTR